MKCLLSVKAYAKVNLHLAVGKKGLDGFHPIVSLFHKVSLYDDIEITLNKDVSSFSVLLKMDKDYQIDMKENIGYKAAMLFFNRYRKQSSWPLVHCFIMIKKRIPFGGGLGGGSSDAAAILKALNELYENPFSQEALMEMGAKLGSDVPFFLCKEAALVKGRGEIVVPYKTKSKPYILLVKPDICVSTKEAYNWIDEYKGFVLDLAKEEERVKLVLQKKEVWDESFFNSFEEVVSNNVKSIKTLLSILRGYNKNSAMSGSGSVCFSIFDSEDEMKRVAKNIEQNGLSIWQKKLL